MALDEKMREEHPTALQVLALLIYRLSRFQKGLQLPVKIVTTIKAPYEGQYTVPLNMRTGKDKAACYPSCCF